MPLELIARVYTVSCCDDFCVLQARLHHLSQLFQGPSPATRTLSWTRERVHQRRCYDAQHAHTSAWHCSSASRPPALAVRGEREAVLCTHLVGVRPEQRHWRMCLGMMVCDLKASNIHTLIHPLLSPSTWIWIRGEASGSVCLQYATS